MFKFLGKSYLYFRRGYGTYISFPLSIVHISLISYNFAFKNFVFIPEWMKHTYVFSGIFLLTFIPLSVIIGYIDMTYGTYKSEAKTGAMKNPIWIDLFNRLERIERKLDGSV